MRSSPFSPSAGEPIVSSKRMSVGKAGALLGHRNLDVEGHRRLRSRGKGRC